MRAPALAFEVHRGPDIEPKSEPRPEPTPEPKSETSAELSDLRFRALMTDTDWASLPLVDPPPFQQAPRRRTHGGLFRRNPGHLDEPGGLVPRPGRAPHRRPAAADARRSWFEPIGPTRNGPSIMSRAS